MSVRRQCQSWSIKRGNRSVKALAHRSGLCLMKKKTIIAELRESLLITNSLQLKQNKNAKFCRENYGGNNKIFVKFINNILQKRILPSMSSPEIHRGSEHYYGIIWKTTRTAINCMNDSKDFQDAESEKIHTLPINQEYSHTSSF